MMTTARMDLYENLHRAARFDADRTYPMLFQRLGYRKAIAEQLLYGGDNHIKMEELQKMYEHVNNEIKLIIGI